tara:strand:- start:15281 stop:16270 length:990 start_codon:yes stop_codon:yes gene_type:complete
MKTKLKSGKNFRLIAAIGLASICLMFASCEKDQLVNPNNSKQAAESNTNGQELVSNEQKQLLLELIPQTRKKITDFAEQLSGSINTIYGNGVHNLYEVATDTFYIDVPLMSGEISFVNQQVALLETAAEIINLLSVANENRKLIFVEVISVADNGTGGVLGLRALTELEILYQLEFCENDNSQPYATASRKLRNLFNACSRPKYRGQPIGESITVHISRGSHPHLFNNDANQILYSSNNGSASHYYDYSNAPAGKGITKSGMYHFYHRMKSLAKTPKPSGISLPELASPTQQSYIAIMTVARDQYVTSTHSQFCTITYTPVDNGQIIYH